VYFNNLCSPTAKLSQCATWAATDTQLANATGTNLVAYLAGQRTHEMSSATAGNRVFRTRQTPLGDFVNAAPVYVKRPPFGYTDPGYAAFKSDQSGRTAVVYAASNDGMLHAFRASNGEEMWAYVPSMVMPEMYRLASANYGEELNHRFYVDATPVMGDIYHDGRWKTILVGGLGAGGRGYYALDITVPDQPRALWEFTDTHLGLTFGNPIIAKNKTGQWVVAFTSGYDNNVGSGDGNGRLYVVDAITGVQVSGSPIQTYTTGVVAAGTAAQPNSLGRINAWVDSELDNTALRIYGGDQLGNMWRFDFDDRVAPTGNEAMLLGIARSSSGNAVQPISIRPQLTEIGGRSVVSFATGRLLGQSDLSDTTVQSVYAVSDDLGTTSYGVLRNHPMMVQRTVAANFSSSPCAPSPIANWFVDLPVTKERVNVDMQQQFYTLTVASNIPQATPCSPGGTGRLYYFDLRSACVLRGFTTDNLIVGLTTISKCSTCRDPQSPEPPPPPGGDDPATIVTEGDGSLGTSDDPDPDRPGGSTTRRTSWRELVR
jgi:type IV pilus assembly protein PilY1